MRMHCLLLSVVLALAATGCTEPMPIDRISVLAPGRDMRLAFRSEMQMDGVGTPGSSLVWMDLELPMTVIATPELGSLRVTMTIRRLRAGSSCTVGGETKLEESDGFEVGDESQPKGESVKLLRDAKFFGVVDPKERLVSAEATGKYWTELKKGLAESIKKQNASQAQVDMTLRAYTLGVFSALEDAMAYFPPEGQRTGQLWKVRRERVFAYRSFEFGMVTTEL